MTTAFIAGATGYTGREVVRECAARGIVAVAHVRPDSRELAEWRRRFAEVGATVDATPWELDAMRHTLTTLRPDIVFALLGTTRRRAARAHRAGSSDSYETVDYGLSRLLLDAALSVEPRPRFVYLSALGVGGSSNPYYEVRSRFERELSASGCPYVITRPSFITGPDRAETRPLERLGAGVADAGLGLIGWLGARRTHQRYRSNSGAGLARGLLRCARDPEALGRIIPSEDLQDEARDALATPRTGA